MSLFLPAIQLFNEHQVSYVVVGGIATVLHGHVRLTADLDIVLLPDENNILKAMSALEENGYIPKIPVQLKDFADFELRKCWINEKNMRVFSVFLKDNPIVQIDFFLEPPMEYDILYGKSEIKVLGETQVRICGLQHLIQLKQVAGRPKDSEDIKALKIIQNAKRRN